MQLKPLLFAAVGAIVASLSTATSAQTYGDYDECINAVCPPSIPNPYRQMCIDNQGYTECAALPGGPAYTGECSEAVDQSCLSNLCPPSIPNPYRQYCLEDQDNISECTIVVCD